MLVFSCGGSYYAEENNVHCNLLNTPIINKSAIRKIRNKDVEK